MTPSRLGLRSCQVTPERCNTHRASRRGNRDRGAQFVTRAWQHQIGVGRHKAVALGGVATRRGAYRDLIEQVPLRAVVQKQVDQCSHRRRSALHVDAQDSSASSSASDQISDRAGAIGGGVSRAQAATPDASCGDKSG